MDDNFPTMTEAPLQLIYHTLYTLPPPRTMGSSTAGAELHTAERDIEEGVDGINGEALMTLLCPLSYEGPSTGLLLRGFSAGHCSPAI